MTRRLVMAALTGCLLMAVTGCPAPQERSAEETRPAPSAVDTLPGRPTDASTDLPSYTGPPADAPPSDGPLTTLTAAVDLSAAAPEAGAVAAYAVGTPDGGAHVVLGPGAQPVAHLATVGPTTGGLEVTGWVPVPGVARVLGLHLLPDGTVLLAALQPAQDHVVVGFAVVDPTTGLLRSAVVSPAPADVGAAASAVSADGRTLFLFWSVVGDRTASAERLVTVDVADGDVRAVRDLGGEIAALSVESAGRGLIGLVPLPDGGVALATHVFPVAGDRRAIPTLIGYGDDLEPAGAARATAYEEDAEIYSYATTADGTVFLLAEVTDDVWITAVPARGGAGPVLAQLQSWFFRDALYVEPAQVWALLPSYEGAVPLDLTTGELGAPVDLGCLPGREVRAMTAGADGAVLLGGCDERTPMLWFVGP
jgi:hypothetical protein